MRSTSGASGPRPGAFWVLVALAAALRFGYVLGYPQAPLCPDCTMYDEVGRNVAAGRGFVGGFAADRWDRPARPTPDAPEIGIGPVYPLFLALLYRVSDDPLQAVRLAQAAISTLTLLPIFSLSRRTLGNAVALRATALAAFYPGFLIYSGVILTETLATALLVWAMAAIAAAWDAPTPLRWCGAGIVTAAAILLRAELLVLCVPVALVSWWHRPTVHTTAMVALFAVAIAATMSPWVVRNWRTFHRLIPVSAHDGDTLWISMRGWREWHMEDPELQALAQGRDYVQQEDAMRAAAIREIRAHPLRFAVTRIRRFPDFWLTSHTGNVVRLSESFEAYAERRAVVPLVIKSVLLLANLAMIAAGLIGAARALWMTRAPRVALMATPIVVVAGVHLVLFATGRYQLVIMPFLLAFAATLAAPAAERIPEAARA